jgi:hypothetical protein
MENVKNQSPNASQKLIERAVKVGIKAELIQASKPHYRRHHPMGSTSVPQKVVMLNGIRMSLGQAKQYINAREA